MRRFVVKILAIIGTITLLFFLFLGWSLYKMTAPSSLSFISLQEPLVLNLTLGDQSLPEQPHPGGLLTIIEGRSLAAQTLVEGLNQAAQDTQVKGILLTIEGNALKIASTQEIRNALKAFKESGKFIYVYTDSFGELSSGTLRYYLASIATKIWMMPLGVLNFNGFLIEAPFAKKALENFKIQPQIGRREQYKGFSETFTESDFTAPHKTNMQQIIDDQIAYILQDIARDRGLKTDVLRTLMDTAPHLSKNALDAQLIDEIGYKDQVKDDIEKRINKKPTYVSFDTYANQRISPTSGQKIAIIYVEGLIGKEKTGWNPIMDETVLDATEITKAIQTAVEDDTIKSIVLRVNSSGGYPIASELISREVERAKLKKPIIASLSNYAASGGYWIICNATKIVAQPGTITGSIGVFAGKFVTKEFWENYGVYWKELHNGNNAAIWSTGQDYSEVGWQKLNDQLDQIYEMFIDKVVKGRKLEADKVRQIAKGQVWTGTQALENGLVDVLGGLSTAIDLAKKESGVATEMPITLVHLPAQKSFFGLLWSRANTEESRIFARYPTLQIILQQLDGLFTQPRIKAAIPIRP